MPPAPRTPDEDIIAVLPKFKRPDGSIEITKLADHLGVPRTTISSKVHKIAALGSKLTS